MNSVTSSLERWRLPDGVEELLPAEVAHIETLRRKVLDLFHSWGYETVIPPLIEYLESLLTGAGNDLDLQTFKLTDQLTGRMMGVRADMTPQVARIDAHRLNREGPTRLCYLGSVLHTRPEISGATRSPIQVGAELYGHATIESDLEVIRLMLEMVKMAGHSSLVLDLGHVGIYRGLIEQAGISAADEPQLFDAFQRKAATELEQIVHRVVSDESFREQLITLNSLNGGIEILAKAKSVLDCAVHPAIEQLEKIAAIAEQQQWGVELHFDLAELRGYDYHTGVLFAAYVPQKGIAVAQGGRYDNVGAVFGRARPATGFSGDLKNLVAIEKEHNYPPPAIFASHDESIALYQEIERLRRAGERVVVELPGQHQSAQEMGCDRKLVQQEGRWTVATL
ncbi:MAG: ATP phosphoribosyltransferase regulatory subunit [Gammaproteobacteria bacterium]|jgi:ATP phosphoribosyltransferase regulatory subunit|nr:ATP phosphoribosyltransferase regulatory subunit [Gammaproteobacteria bacterium]MBT3489158.1 ATP phosphoribosyltransferase regulatory subunit [Gammaproteobacteria bacterium]MBT3717579.1 ATP phosphoribosyltransferase regulatory subunit [Gammaproteobacteria bacterium]MBT3845332.1 ATP phosphoribosyltransferase regulatory subunit [Gammaproteobacteria bacterium]MBT3892507.1 ATP phosphoribosyltransferase regulatory subunit [Gammaproteobacteria bacterium]